MIVTIVHAPDSWVPKGSMKRLRALWGSACVTFGSMTVGSWEL